MSIFSKAPLVSKEELAAIVAALKDAEKGNRGEVRVHLERKCPYTDALARAKELFHSLGMDRTKEGTGVLLYVAVEDRKTAVFAGKGLHKLAERAFWQSVSDAVAKGFKDGKPAEGFVAATTELGELLRKVVPGEDVSGNELPDEVTTS